MHRAKLDRIMDIPVFLTVAAIVMASVVIFLLVSFRQYRIAASARRIRHMLEYVGLDPDIAASDDTKAIMKGVRQRCLTCTTEDVCDRWLDGDDHSYNSFCPNAVIFNQLKAHYNHPVGP